MHVSLIARVGARTIYSMGRAPTSGAPQQRVSAHVVPKSASPFLDDDEKTTIESGWEEEASTTTVEQGEIAEKIRQLGLEQPRSRNNITNITSTNGHGVVDEPTVDDQRANASIALIEPPAGGRLVITQGNDTGQQLEAAPGRSYTIGRGIDNDLVLTDIAVSRKHFDLRHEDGSWVIADRGSGNGTLVNGNVEDQPFPLANGDHIEIGNTTFRFEWSGPAPLRTPALPPQPQPAPLPPPAWDAPPRVAQTYDLDEEEPSTVAGKPVRPEPPTPQPLAAPPVRTRQKTVPPPAPLPRLRAPTAPPPPPFSAGMASGPAGMSGGGAMGSLSPHGRPTMPLPRQAAGQRQTAAQRQQAAQQPTHTHPSQLAHHPSQIHAAHQLAPMLPPPPHSGLHHQPPHSGLHPQPASTLPLPQMANRGPLAPTLLGVDPGQQLKHLNGGPSTIPGQGMPVGYNGYPLADHRAQMLVIGNQMPRDATSTAQVPPTPYGSLIPPPPASYAQPPHARRTKWLLLLGGAGLTLAAALATVAIIKGSSGSSGSNGSGTPVPTTAATPPPPKPAPRPVVEPIREPIAKGTVAQTPTKAATPPPKPVAPAPVVPAPQVATVPAPTPQAAVPTPAAPPVPAPTPAPTPAPVAVAPTPAPTPPPKAAPPTPAPTPVVRATPPPPPKADPPRRTPTPPPPKADPPRREARRDPPKADPPPRRVAAADSDTSGAKSRAEQQYRSKKFTDAAATLRAAASAAGSGDARDLRSQASVYEQFGKAYNRGMSPGASASEALADLKRALNFDNANAFSDEIRSRISEVAPKAAVSFLAGKQYEAAFAAVRTAESVGGSNGTTKSVRANLEATANKLYTTAAQEWDTDRAAATEKLKQVRQMVDSSTAVHGKATKLLADG